MDMDSNGARRLVAAMLLRAARDARSRGKYAAAARAWLASEGTIWADELGISFCTITSWLASLPH